MIAPRRLLFRRLLQWGDPRQDDLDSCAAAGLGIEVETSAQTVGHDTVDNVQAEPSAALIAPRREEWIERAAPDIERHAAAVVGKNDFDIVLARLPYLNIDRARLAVGKRVRHRIEEQLGEYLSVGPGITVHDEVGLAVDGERQIVLSQARPQAHHDLLG